MSRYKIVVLPAAEREIAALSKQDQKRVVKVLEGLADNPRPPGCKKLVGSPFWRVRFGPYRVVYSIEDNVLTIEIIKVAHRKDVYK